MPASPPPAELTKPSAQLRLDQARTNYQLYREFKARGDHSDWALVFLFYAALHLVDAWLYEIATSGFDLPTGHTNEGPQSRDVLILRKIPRIRREYRVLLNHSHAARYRLEVPKPSAEQLQAFEDTQFAHIVRELQKLYAFTLE